MQWMFSCESMNVKWEILQRDTLLADRGGSEHTAIMSCIFEGMSY